MKSIYLQTGNLRHFQSSYEQIRNSTFLLIRYMETSMNKKKILTTNIRIITLLFMFALPLMVQAQSLPDLIEQARAVGIEQSQIAELQNRAADRGISEAELLNIIRPAVAMAEQNLPYEMIFDKAFEGLSKRVPAPQIQSVLNSISENSAEASRFVDPWVQMPEVRQMLDRSGERMDQNRFRNEMIKASAKGLTQNFNRDVLEQTLASLASSIAMENARPSEIVTAISILSDLPTAAQQPAETSRMVISALESGFDASDLQKLPGALNMAQRRAQLPAQAVAEGFRRQLEGGFPASQVLQNLFNGRVGGGPPGGTPPGLNRERPGRRGGG